MVNGVTIVVDDSYRPREPNAGYFCMYVSPLGCPGLMSSDSQLLYIDPLAADVCSYVEYILVQHSKNFILMFLETMLMHALTVKSDIHEQQ